MIQYIVAAGIGGLLGLSRKKGKKFADGGTTDGKPKVTEIQEYLFKMDGTEVAIGEADEVEKAWGTPADAEDVYNALARKEIYLEEYAPELFEQDEDGVIEVGGIEDLKSGVTIEDIVDAIEDEPFMKADNSYNYSAPFVFDFRFVKTDDPYEEQIYFVREHRGGDVRGNYGPYQAVIMDSVEDSPLYARVFVSLETDKGRVELESEDLEAYNFEVREDATGVLEQGEMVNIDELEEKFNFSGVKSDMLNIFEKGGQTDEDEARAKKEYMEDYGADAEEAEEQFSGVFRDKEDFAADWVEQTGFDSFIDNERFLEPDKIGFREWASNLADAMASDIDEDNADEYAERLGLEDEYEEAEEKGGQAMEDFLDKLREKEAEELYDEFMRQGGSAPDILALVSDYGMDAQDAIDAYLVRVDYEEIADALEDDGYVYIEQGSDLYVFNPNMARGGMTKMADGGKTKLETRMTFFMAQEYLDKADKALSRGGEGFYTARKAIEKAYEEIVEAAQMLPRDEGMEALRIILPPLRKAQKPAEKASTKLAAIGETQRAIEKFLTTTMQLKHGGQTHGSLVFEKVDFPALEREGIQRHEAEGENYVFMIHEYVTPEAKEEYGDSEFGGSAHLYVRDRGGHQVDYIRFLDDYDDAVEFANRQNSGEIGIGRERYAKGGRPYRNLKLYNEIADAQSALDSGAYEARQDDRDDVARHLDNAAVDVDKAERKYSNPPEEPFAHGGKTQGYNDKLDESLGSRRGAGRSKEQGRKDRRDESEAMEKSMGRRKYAAVGTMDMGRRKMADGGVIRAFDEQVRELEIHPNDLWDEQDIQSRLVDGGYEWDEGSDDWRYYLDDIEYGVIEDKNGKVIGYLPFDEIDSAVVERAFEKGGKTKKIGFDKLAEEVAEEYREKGMSKAEAEEIGKGTAAKVFRAQQARKKRKK